MHHRFGKAAASKSLRRVVAVALVASCSSSEGLISATEPQTGRGTVFALASVNDVAPPSKIQAGTSAIEISRGALTLGADSTWIFSLATRTSVNGGPATSGTTTLRGTTRLRSPTLSLMQLDDTMFVGTYSPNVVSLRVVKAQAIGERFVFVR